VKNALYSILMSVSLSHLFEWGENSVFLNIFYSEFISLRHFCSIRLSEPSKVREDSQEWESEDFRFALSRKKRYNTLMSLNTSDESAEGLGL
jgi:hypothetical protein